MKIINKGMTLAEVLIALAIAAIIATIGFTFAQKSAERAYDLYVYTGYKGLHDAFSEARYEGLGLNNEFLGANSCNNRFISTVSELLSAECRNDRFSITLDDLPAGNNGVILRAPNNIWYEIVYYDVDQNGTDHLFLIDMSVPSQRYSYIDNNGNNVISNRHTYRFFYSQNQSNYIIPSNYIDDLDMNGQQRDRYRFVLDRPDVLPFYIDDGLVGRVRPTAGGNYQYQRIQPSSFRQAFCETRGLRFYGKPDTNYFSYQIPGIAQNFCNGIQSNIRTGILKPLDPRKVN